MKLDFKIKELKQAICQERVKEIYITLLVALNYPTFGKYTSSKSLRAIIKIYQKSYRKGGIVKYMQASFRIYELSLPYSFHLLISPLNSVICILISYTWI